MSHLGEFTCERLITAAEEMERPIVHCEDERDRQHRLQDVTRRPDSSLQRTDAPQCFLTKEVSADQQLRDQQENSSVGQLKAGPPEIKEEQEELWTSQGGEQMVLKQETDVQMVTPLFEEGDHSEPGSHRDLVHSERLGQEGGWPEASGQVRNTELKQKVRLDRKLMDNCPVSECNKDRRDSSLQCEPEASSKPEPPEVKEEQEDLCYSYDEDQLVVKQEIHSFVLTSDYEETDHSESEPNQNQLLSNISPATESQHQDLEGSWDQDSESTRNQISHSNIVDDAPSLDTLCNSDLGNKLLKCVVCGKTFSSNFKMQKHYRIHTGEKPYSCKTCGKAFRESKYLSVHMRTHTGEKPYSCETCGKSFSQTGHLSTHKRIHTGEKPHPCSTCGRRFAEASTLRNHMLTHTREKPFSCHICGKILRYSSSLSAHMKIHTGEKPFVCKTCGKCFSNNSSLISHTRIHTGEKSYQCTTCGRCFSQSTTLLRHTRSHTGERPYSCATCGKCFKSSSHLTAHMTTHTREKLYSCTTCSKRFSHSSNLVRHIRTHTGERPYSCQTCGKRFKSSTHLSGHMKTHRKGCSPEVEIILEDGSSPVRQS